MVGKAERGPVAIEAIRKHGAAYLMAVGGAAYLVSKAIRASRVVAFADLGMEAIYEFDVRDMPVTVAVDARGHVGAPDGAGAMVREDPLARHPGARCLNLQDAGYRHVAAFRVRALSVPRTARAHGSVVAGDDGAPRLSRARARQPRRGRRGDRLLSRRSSTTAC